MSYSSSLDLSKLLLVHATASALASVSIAPSYNLPIALFGLCVTAVPSNEFGADSLRAFVVLLALSIGLDVLWLISWSGQPSALCVFLILVNLAAKPITLLAATANLRQRGEPTLPSFGGNGVVWSMPGGYTAESQGGYQGVGAGSEDAVEYVPEPAPKARTTPAKAAAPKPTPQQPKGPAHQGGYHSIGDDD